jgi:signal transduction histidine kinase
VRPEEKLTMTDKPDNRSWKNFLIRRDVQLPIIAANLVFLAVVTAVLIAVLLSPLYHDMLNADELWVQNLSGNLFLVLLQRTTLAMLLILVAAAVHQIVLSHRFGGPLVNFGHTFDRMAQGDFSRKVHLRKGDFLKAEAARVNTIIDRLNADGKNLKENMDRIAAIAAQLDDQALSPDAQELIGRLRTSVDGCRSTLNGWHHPAEA